MTQKVEPKVEQWMIDAAREIIGSGEAAEGNELSEISAIIASHAPSEADLRQELAQLKAAYRKAIACVPTELLNLYFLETEAEKEK